jgi:hypothetical protein
MAEAHCGICAAVGYRTCDLCAGIVFNPVDWARDLCQNCRGEADEAS